MTPWLVRASRWLVALVCTPDDRAGMVADLDDELHAMTASRGARRAALWYLSQTLRSMPALARYRLRARRRRASGGSTMSALSPGMLLRHLRLGARALGRTPGFTAVTVTTLAIGIGASTATFSALDAALLRPLPYGTHDRLTVMTETRKGDEISTSYPDFSDWRARAGSFEAMAAFRGATVTVTGGVTPERIRGQIVTADLFRVLDTPPLIGRAFEPGLDQPGAPAAAILGYGLWQRRYAGDRGVIGRTIQIEGIPCEIVGVMPNGFDFPSGIVYAPAELYLSSGAAWEADFANRDSHPGLEVVGLRRPGVTLAQARDEMLGIAAALRADYPASNRDIGVLVRDAVTVIVGDLRGQLQMVTAASLALLLIACANVAALTLTRAIARRRELAVRAALGAGRGALVVGLVAENVVLTAAGAALGVGLAYALTASLKPFVAELPRLDALQPDLRVLAFAIAAMLTTTALCSAAPVIWLKRAPLDPWLRERGQARRGWRTRQFLVGAQVALALTLLSAAALLATSLQHLEGSRGGIQADHALVFNMRLPERAYAEARIAPFYDALYERLRAQPGVTSVGGISVLPFGGGGAQTTIRPRGGDDSTQVRTDVAVVSGDYFRAMGVSLVRGRLFDERDSARAPRVAVVDERFASRFWPGAYAIGQHLQGWGVDDMEVVGVVGHVDNYGVGAPSREELYMHMPQRPRAQMITVVRTAGDAAPLVAFARTTVADLDPSLAISNVRMMRDVVDATIAGPKLAAVLGGSFGIIAVLLAAVGISGMVGYAVELRRREAGIRMALGAKPGSVVTLMVLGTTGALAGGAAVGFAGAIAAGRLLDNQLFGVPPHGGAVPVLSAVVLIVIAIVACWLPALRASRVSPTIVLQEE